MQSFIRRGGRASLLGVLCLVSAGAALAASGPARAKITIKGGPSFKINAYSKESFHYVGGTIPIQSGGTVTLTNTTPEGHSLSLVKKSDLPRTLNQIFMCRVCGPLFLAHGINPNGPPTHGPPPHLVVNVGAPGFDTPGDSVVIGPKGKGPPVTFTVTAKPGTILYFMCIFHPYMQGRFLVK